LPSDEHVLVAVLVSPLVAAAVGEIVTLGATGSITRAT
jgi:hypothetical protein